MLLNGHRFLALHAHVVGVIFCGHRFSCTLQYYLTSIWLNIIVVDVVELYAMHVVGKIVLLLHWGSIGQFGIVIFVHSVRPDRNYSIH